MAPLRLHLHLRRLGQRRNGRANGGGAKGATLKTETDGEKGAAVSREAKEAGHKEVGRGERDG